MAVRNHCSLGVIYKYIIQDKYISNIYQEESSAKEENGRKRVEKKEKDPKNFTTMEKEKETEEGKSRM